MKRALLALAACHAPAGWRPAAARELELGTRVILVENHRLPLVAVEVVELDAGSREDHGAYGLASLTGDLIAPQLAGAHFRVDVTSDAAIAELETTAVRLPAAMHALAGALATLDDARFERARDARVAQVRQHAENPRTIAAQTFDRIVFGGHPYAHPAEGEADALAAVTLADVHAFHAAHYRHPVIVVVGDIDRAQLAPLLAGFTASVAVAPPPLAPATPADRHVTVAGESVVILAGGRGQAAPAPDRVAADVANTMLGGAPGARLDRAFAGMSLAASSSFWRGAAGGSWTVAATVRSADLPRAIETMKRELARRDFTDAELAAAKAQLRAAFPRPFESVAGTARAYARLVATGAPLALFADYLARLDAITRADALRAVDALWRDLSIVTVGP